MLDAAELREAYQQARCELAAFRDPSGHWVGELSSSALATATAASALALVERRSHGSDVGPGRLRTEIDRAIAWLARHQNGDGGWGDTDKSHSNIATTMLAEAAFHLAGAAESHVDMLGRARNYIVAEGGVDGLRRRYGKDKTFAVPILTNAALAGLVPWREVPPLPFEMACLSNRLLGVLRLPVVSYAIPALVAIGQARYFNLKPRNPLVRLVRGLSVKKSLAVLRQMQPESGGYLEATPLTSFVVMSLAATGRADNPVVRDGVRFLLASVRPDGSWPIDTNLATWLTSLAIGALGADDTDGNESACLDWLLACQHRKIHPLTRAAVGGWGWSDLSGAVPDADDTAGALLALAILRRRGDSTAQSRIDRAAALGIRWLMNLQNSDGGWPTFCRGWGALPFDRSGVDLTAHAIRALNTWRVGTASSSPTIAGSLPCAIKRGLAFLARQQHEDGRWTPLWFGNQDRVDEENPVYGTARTLLAYRDLGLMAEPPARRGLAWLAANRNPDGGWGGGPAGPSSVEETAVAVEALLGSPGDRSLQVVAEQGLQWLISAVRSGRHHESSPIGLYFAKLWYYERLYPLVFLVSALSHARSSVLDCIAKP